MPQYSLWPIVPHFVGSGSEEEITRYLDWMVCTMACRITSLPELHLRAKHGLWAPPASPRPEHHGADVPSWANMCISFCTVVTFPTSALRCQNNCLKEEALWVIKCHQIVSVWLCRHTGLYSSLIGRK